MPTSWWLCWGALPDRLIWARLEVGDDGSAVVFDCDGKYHHFPDELSARWWLSEDEYSRFEHLIEDGEVGPEVVPPGASCDRELVPQMVMRQEVPSPGPPGESGAHGTDEDSVC